jgi:glycosyltransferase involved in cell wall biosynthesis
MVPDKDHATLLSAFRTVVERLPDAELWLAGNGPLRDAIRRRAAAELPPRCFRFMEPKRDIEPWLHAAGVLALPSIREALPNVVLEAMATGLPVVATDAGGLPEAVENERTGLVVPAGDSRRLAEAILRLLSDARLRESFGRAGRLRAERLFDIATMVRRHEEVFERLHRIRTGESPPDAACAGR